MPGPAFWQIGSDGGYLAEPVLLNDPNDAHSPRLIMAPGERCDVVVDFSGYATGTELLLKNTAKAPFPSGEAPDPQTVGQIMLFRVVDPTAPDDSVIPPQLATVNRLTNPTVTRVMTLNEMMSAEGPIGALLNGMSFHDAPATEYPELGATEMWEVVNMTGDSHPIHLHLVQFQLLNRQKINVRRYEHAFMQASPEMPAQTYNPVPVDRYLKGKPVPADANERGWKDTFRMNPGEVTRILVRFAPQDESPAFAFDATAEPGYVWHCHILEHEENDMMRPYHLVAPAPAVPGIADILGAGSAAVAPATLQVPSRQIAGGISQVRFSLGASSDVTVDLFDVAGRKVKGLASGRYEAGEHTVASQFTTDSGQRLAPGVYFVQLRGGGGVHTQRVVLTR
jgi:FtsP/CotA-like multicopper oxidase with cupredoxin domain